MEMAYLNGYAYPADSRKARHHLETLAEGYGTLMGALSMVANCGVAVDGGAFIGTFSRVLGTLFQQVYSFEPSAPEYAALVENLRLQTNVQYFQQALGDKIGECGNLPQGFGSYCVPGGTGCPMTTIDSLQLPRCDFIKLDVEGYELLALQGAQATLQKFQPVLLLETKPFPDVDREALGAWLRQLGYREQWYRKPDSLWLPQNHGGFNARKKGLGLHRDPAPGSAPVAGQGGNR